MFLSSKYNKVSGENHKTHRSLFKSSIFQNPNRSSTTICLSALFLLVLHPPIIKTNISWMKNSTFFITNLFFKWFYVWVVKYSTDISLPIFYRNWIHKHIFNIYICYFSFIIIQISSIILVLLIYYSFISNELPLVDTAIIFGCFPLKSIFHGCPLSSLSLPTSPFHKLKLCPNS